MTPDAIVCDLNCDLGEGVGDDAAVLPFVTSANVACGQHAGDPAVMRRTVAEARRRGVAVGAHPGYPDRTRFGRVELPLTAAEVGDLLRYQLGALVAIAAAEGVRLSHLKLHGALYHVAAARDDVAAATVAALGRRADLIVVGPPSGALEAAARAGGLRYAAEAFPDRHYGEDGRLLPRERPDALVGEAGGAPEEVDAEVAARAVAMVRHQSVVTARGTVLPQPVHTLCLHGDHPRAPQRAAAVRAALEAAGVAVRPLGTFLP